MKYIIVLMSALCMFVMPVSGEQVNKAEQPMQGTTVKQVHSESKTVLSDDLDTFHVNSSHTPDHVIGQGGLEMPDCTDRRRNRGCSEPSCHCAFRKTGSPCTVWKHCSR